MYEKEMIKNNSFRSGPLSSSWEELCSIINQVVQGYVCFLFEPKSTLQPGTELFHLDLQACGLIVSVSSADEPSIEIEKNTITAFLSLQALQNRKRHVLYFTFTAGGYCSLFLNGRLIGFVPSDTAGSHFTLSLLKTAPCLELSFSGAEDRVLSFSQRAALHTHLEQEYGIQSVSCPVFQFQNILLSSENATLRDPSEILHINGYYWVYFTLVPSPLTHGFTGSIYGSCCVDDCDPSIPENWSQPFEVIPKGNPDRDHDGTGCFTPDCFWDGKKVSVFYTALNSTHNEGFPQWGEKREPEHILVASCDNPRGPFIKNPKHTPLSSRKLDYSEATVPGGHTTWQGTEIEDTSLIDHGQCWVMPDGERRYYYKGGTAWKNGSVCVIRNLDENWLNGQRMPGPIIDEGTHMEGILITQSTGKMYLQLALIRENYLWRTYQSDARDGLNWELIDSGYLPIENCDYPLSIGVFHPRDPLWGIGQFPTEKDRIALGFMNVI